jgi:O-antigen ligase
MHAITMALLALWCIGFARSSAAAPGSVRNNRVPLFFFSLWIAYIALQVLPMPAAILEILSPRAYAHYTTVQSAGFTPTFSISLDRGSSLGELQKISAYIALFFLTIALVTSRKRLRLVLVILTIIGTLEAFYAIVAYLARGQPVLSFFGADGRVVTGTYVNKNHFAGLMEVTIPAALGLMLAGSSKKYGHDWREALRKFADFFLRDAGWLSFCLVLMLTALILSASRGGIAALIFGTSFAVVVAVIFRGRGTRESGVLVRLTALVIVGVTWLGAGELVEKLENIGLASNRGDIRDTTLKIIEDFWLTGSGAGTFRWVFPIYKDGRFGSGFYEHAHNDYLELLSEQGIMGLMLAGIAIATLLLRIVIAYVRRNDSMVRGALFFAISASAALMAHGGVDFNFNIPANAAIFFVLLGVGAAAGRLETRGAGIKAVRPMTRT